MGLAGSKAGMSKRQQVACSRSDPNKSYRFCLDQPEVMVLGTNKGILVQYMVLGFCVQDQYQLFMKLRHLHPMKKTISKLDRCTFCYEPHHY